ncbi:efflux RND transporter periplasmic adaptor subunit [Pseudoteredinibacter isoporae]|uniref:Multidrug efflux pump subunit AcrA (Membrane-fusion protein) n=1 Tax=Pseudoteredinibacter isoporae TaxID=570281 RepID=A0A7X0JSK2_9GAMM|nr:efflux RND transporter periplasmic adaptor subunit [Pseudoteredinibacter isoporae]MBB6520601.1 multidrug efflux pump subunit AcrA (membrane-fusion protein) [Pseudoteredinibacter isoporae]NHO86168.1 efflux RND transporter periplasmic adaptor subunit [Pseudoteredinibacter isoporae]NIB25381.1 efflux RND transporter periplasmic adaptor subunit [Pseudoteredinibacter isoporae]
MKKLLLLSLLLSVQACTEQRQEQTISVVVEKKDFEVLLRAKGELHAKDNKRVSAPVSSMHALRLEWLKPENSFVKEGELLARFDASRYQLIRQRAMWSLQQHSLAKNNTKTKLNIEQLSVLSESNVVAAEMEMSERFSVDDLLVYSKNEIADQMLDKEYLGSKQEYLDWRKDTSSAQGSAQLAVHEVKEQSEQRTIERNDKVLKQLNIYAPQDGVFVHHKNWRGEKVQVGQQLLSGSKLGSIPNLEALQAKLYVLESEALGIEPGQSVKLNLDAFPDKGIRGELLSISSVASPRSQRSPINYFEVIVQLEETDPDFMRPGQRLEGQIAIVSKPDTLTVPRQSLFSKDGLFWVYVKMGDAYERRVVNLGVRSLSRVEIRAGLEAGESVALSLPENIVGS